VKDILVIGAPMSAPAMLTNLFFNQIVTLDDAIGAELRLEGKGMQASFQLYTTG
jgi:hypothetical protein